MTVMEKTEARIQQDIVRWYRNNYCLKHHAPRCIILSIPNSKNPQLREVGMMSGASDLLVIRRHMAYFVEIKTVKGRQSPAQKKFQAHIKQMDMIYVVIRSLGEFKEFIL